MEKTKIKAVTDSDETALAGHAQEKAAHVEAAAATEEAPKSIRGRLIAAGVLAVAGVGVVVFYMMKSGYENTDDAQVEADVVAVPARTGGVVQKVFVVENQTIKAGEVIAEIDPAVHEAKLAQAEAELASAQAAAAGADAEVTVVETTSKGQRSVAEASLRGSSVGVQTTAEELAQAKAQVQASTAARRQAELDLERAKKLFEENAVPKQKLDAAQNAFDAADANLAQTKARVAAVESSAQGAVARVSEAQARLGQSSSVGPQIAQARARAQVAHARVDTAKATRDLAKLDYSYTKITAPRDGIASKKTVSVGQLVSPGQPVIMLVPVGDVWITANFKETQLFKMRPGQSAEIEIDAFSGLKLEGEVESLSGATGSRFSLLPAENATGNFVKVVQRVPVRIKVKAPPDGKVLRPGMSADVTVDVRK